MAVTLIASPAIRVEAGISLRWTFNMVGTTEHPIYRKFGYQFCNEAGTAIGSPESFTPIDGVDFYIEFIEDARATVTTVPVDFELIEEAGFGIVGVHPDMKKGVRLKYWEIVTDLENCPSVVEGEALTEVVTIFNTCSNRFIKTNLSITHHDYLFSYKPSFINCSSKFRDLIYLSGNGTIVYKFYSGNTLVSEGDLVFSHTDVRSYAVGPGNFEVGPSITRINIEVSRDISSGRLGSVNYSYIIDCYDEVYQIWYQSILGGYNGMELFRDELTVISEFIETERYNSNIDFDSEAYHTNGGLTIQNKKSTDKVRLSKQLDNFTEKEVHYLRDFAASSNYIIMLKDFSDKKKASKIILEPNIVIENENLNLSVSAKLNETYKMPNSSYKSTTINLINSESVNPPTVTIDITGTEIGNATVEDYGCEGTYTVLVRVYLNNGPETIVETPFDLADLYCGESAGTSTDIRVLATVINSCGESQYLLTVPITISRGIITAINGVACALDVPPTITQPVPIGTILMGPTYTSGSCISAGPLDISTVIRRTTSAGVVEVALDSYPFNLLDLCGLESVYNYITVVSRIDNTCGVDTDTINVPVTRTGGIITAVNGVACPVNTPPTISLSITDNFLNLSLNNYGVLPTEYEVRLLAFIPSGGGGSSYDVVAILDLDEVTFPLNLNNYFCGLEVATDLVYADATIANANGSDEDSISIPVTRNVDNQITAVNGVDCPVANVSLSLVGGLLTPTWDLAGYTIYERTLILDYGTHTESLDYDSPTNLKDLLCFVPGRLGATLWVLPLVVRAQITAGGITNNANVNVAINRASGAYDRIVWGVDGVNCFTGPVEPGIPILTGSQITAFAGQNLQGWPADKIAFRLIVTVNGANVEHVIDSNLPIDLEGYLCGVTHNNATNVFVTLRIQTPVSSSTGISTLVPVTLDNTPIGVITEINGVPC